MKKPMVKRGLPAGAMVYMQEIGVKKTPQIIINIICFAVLAGAIVALLFCDKSAINQEGFFCDDRSISYPERNSTITDVHLVVGSVAFSFLAIIMCEMIAFFELWGSRKVANKDEESGEVTDEKRDEEVVREYPGPGKILMARIGMQMILLIYGFMLIVFATEVIKISMGRLRPNFFAVCKLVPGSYNCSDGFVTEYECSQENGAKIADSRKSFLSGHASVSFFHMIFIIFYIQPRLPVRYWAAMKPLLQTLAFVLAMYVSITRVTDYKHHYSDVVFGGMLGAVAGALMAFKIGHVVPFRQRPFPKPSKYINYYTYWHASPGQRPSISSS